MSTHNDFTETDDALEFVYLEKKTINVGDTQTVITSFNNSDNENIILNYHNKDGQTFSCSSKEYKNNMAIFNIEFNNTNESSSYTLDNVTWKNKKNFTQSIENNEFYVIENKKDEAAGTSRNITYSNTSLKQNNPLTVALDPGHGGNDPGAAYGTHKESDLNWAISEACKKELETYEGVSTVVTKSQNETLNSLKTRVERGHNAGANLFVSLHNNSSESSSASGCEVWVQHGMGWHSEFNGVGTDIGQKITDKISRAFGIANRSTKSSTATDGSTYPDGTIGDYYNVLYWSRMYEMPAMIVEHAFINGSPADQAALFNPQNLEKMGILDAQAIAEHYNLHKKSQRTPEIINGTFEVNTCLNQNKALDIYNGSKDNEANVQIYQSNSTEAQKWTISTDQATGLATIMNVGSGKVLDIYGGSIQPGTNVWQYNFNNSDAQKWKIYKDNDTYTICSAINDNIVLDVAGGISSDGTNVQVYSSNASNAQKWSFKQIQSKPEIFNGDFTICSASNQSKVAEVANSSKEDCANVQLYEFKGIVTQTWKITTDVNGIAKIINRNSNKVLDIYNGTIASGTNIDQYTDNRTPAQQWKIVKVPNGYKIVSYADEKYVLDIYGGKIEDASNIQLYEDNGSIAQKWLINPYNDKPGDEVNGNFVITSSMNNLRTFDVAGGSIYDNANIQIYDNNYSTAQRWIVSTDKNTHLSTITNIGSKKVLSVESNNVSSSSNICQLSNKGLLSQQWKFTKENNVYTIHSAVNHNLVLDIYGGICDNGANIQLYSSNNSPAQKFILFNEQPTIEPSTANIDTNNSYKIMNIINGNEVFDLRNGSSDNGTQLQIYNWNNSQAQKFKFEKEGNYYRIKHSLSGKSIDVSNGNFMPFATIQLWDTASTNNQLWTAYKNKDNSITFMNVASGLVLDIYGGRIENGTKITGYPSNNTDAQKWVLQKVEDSKLTPIMYSQRASASQMVNYFNNRHVTYPSVYESKGAASIYAFCNLCVSTATSEGVDPLVLFAQAMLETNALQFGGQVKAEQCNFGGLGATDGGASGATFPNVETGLLAQSQHLKAYACKSPLNRPCVDERFKYVTRGIAPNVEDLGNGKWATDPNYASKLLSIMRTII